MQYRTKDGDVLDKIAYKQYGRESAVDELLEANPQLVEIGPVFPGGLVIELPEIIEKPTKQTISLWD